jgi:hypothetical protein
MKLLLLLISITLLSTSASTCNKSASAETTTNAVDSLSAIPDTMHTDTTVTSGDPQSPSSNTTPVDSLSKEVKSQSSGTKHEAPKHDSPNQEKVDSIKASKKKKK